MQDEVTVEVMSKDLDRMVFAQTNVEATFQKMGWSSRVGVVRFLDCHPLCTTKNPPRLLRVQTEHWKPHHNTQQHCDRRRNVTVIENRVYEWALFV